MIKTIVISAGGRGTRMGTLTSEQPKHLIPVNGRPFINYVLDQVIRAGFINIIVVIGYKKERWVSALSNLPVTVTVVNQHDRLGDKYGTACPIQAAEPEIGSRNFIAANGDNLYSANDLKAICRDDNLNYIAGFAMEKPERYGVLEWDKSGYLVKIHEKSANPPTNLINAGLYKFTPGCFEAVKKTGLSPRGEYEITDTISSLAKRRLVKVQTLQDYWHDFGQPDDIDKLAEFLKTQTGLS